MVGTDKPADNNLAVDNRVADSWVVGNPIVDSPGQGLATNTPAADKAVLGKPAERARVAGNPVVLAFAVDNPAARSQADRAVHDPAVQAERFAQREALFRSSHRISRRCIVLRNLDILPFFYPPLFHIPQLYVLRIITGLNRSKLLPTDTILYQFRL